MRNDPPVFPGRVDPSDRFRQRRRHARHRRRLRRILLAIAVIGGIVALALNARFISSDDEPEAAPPAAAAEAPAPAAPAAVVVERVPDEVRGVHVTAPLASIPGKLEEYAAMKANGLNTIQLDVKDENGEIGFLPAKLQLAREAGAAQEYYDPEDAARIVHEAGLYLIGRIVVFQDPRVSHARPDLAIQTPSGEIWTTRQGLGWVNPYDERVWDYNLDIAEAAAKAGFDEIMFDYVRFPTDGSTAAVYPGQDGRSKADVIAGFVERAKERLAAYDVEVSAALFGLAATRDLGIGQRPRLLAKHLDAIYPMVYPSHYNSGEFDISDPSAEPGLTVSFSLVEYKADLQGRDVRVTPWLQDWNYDPAAVEQQISAARRAGTAGYMLWNSSGLYTASALDG